MQQQEAAERNVDRSAEEMSRDPSEETSALAH
jgi:hypothetical protein